MNNQLTRKFLQINFFTLQGKNSILLVLTSCLLSLASGLLAQPDRYIAGRDYTVITNPLPDRTPDVVEVTEFFWYGCPGCFAFESQLNQWINAQEDNVMCERLPAVWSDWHEVHARAYYTARSLDVLDPMHDILFNSMHLEGKRLRDEKELGDLFVANGIAKEDFTRVYNSFTVNTEINRAKSLALQAAARSTPSMIVNGKYLVTLSRDTLDIVDFLVQKELPKI